MISLATKKLTVVIPALNEEDAIGGTLTRCLNVSNQICEESGLNSIEWIVVSDGSSDGTVRIASEIAQNDSRVRVVAWERNRGYGAAIQHGFHLGSGDLVAFLDADGTCDPACFSAMCRMILTQGAEIVIGSRMSPESKMPRIRRIGNWLYAILLGFLTGRSVTDAASGMRVLTRDAWRQLRPLPNGLHFTPAMSAKALATQMRIEEIVIPYADRIGRSKLNVVRDGVRFLHAILGGILSVRPDRLLGLVFALCCLFTAAISAFPIEHYWRNHKLEEWMIYRFFACYLLGQAGFTTYCAVALTHRLANFGPQRRSTDSFFASVAAYSFRIKPMIVWNTICIAISLWLIREGIYDFFTTRTVELHWSRMFVTAFLMSIVFQAIVTSILLGVIGMWVDARQVSEDGND